MPTCRVSCTSRAALPAAAARTTLSCRRRTGRLSAIWRCVSDRPRVAFAPLTRDRRAHQVVDNNGVVGYRRGMTQLEVYNATTLTVRQLDINGTVFDTFTVEVQRHGGPF